MSFKPYPKYKESGVEWLGRVPEHWEVTRLKHCARLITAKAESRSNPLALENIEGWTGRLIPSEGDYQGEGTAFGSGDILFGKLRPYLAKVHLADRPGEAVGDFHVLRPEHSLDGRFAQYGMLTREFIGIVDGSTYGSKMPRASWEFVGGMPIALPPSCEQPRIAAFLDAETAKIDALIAEQQRLIELLQEKRQAVISHAVTKGLNPDAPMKDSGIEWLGEVPEHWEPRRLGGLYRQLKRQDQSNKQVLSVYRDYGVVPKDSRDDNMNKTPEDLSAYQLVEPGDLVVNKMKAWQGSLGISAHEGITSPDYVVFAPTHKEDSVYLHYILRGRSMADVYRAISNGIRPSQWRLEPDRFLGLTIFLPPAEEQRAIASMIGEIALLYDPMEEECARSIGLLQERRSALISAAVTGQIDVRDFAGGSEAA